METVGFIGVGKIGLPISENLIKSGYRVLGYRRSSLAEFEKLGGVAARSPAEIGAAADIVLSCLPSTQALDEVDRGSARAARERAAGTDHRRARLASRPGQAAPRCATRRQGRSVPRRGGERHPGHGGGAQGRDLSRRRARGLRQGRARDRGLCRLVPVFRSLRGRQQGEAGQQPAGRHPYRRHRRGDGTRAQGRRRRRAHDQGDRNRQRRIDPVRCPSAVDGAATISSGAGHRVRLAALLRYDRRVRRRLGVATPMLDRAAELYEKFIEMGFAELDAAAMVDVITRCRAQGDPA